MVDFEVETVGTYWKLADKTTIPGALPNRFNERVLRPLKEELDLKLGCEGFRDEGHSDRFDSFFDFLCKTHRKGTVLKEAIDADFMSNRRILQLFAITPYRLRPVEIQALRYNDVIFLNEKKEDIIDNSTPYGYKFEQYATLDENGEEHEKSMDVSNAECSKAVLRSTLTSGDETIKMFYAAEIDAIDSDGNFVELKTTRASERKWLQNQSLRHYTQSLLGNVPSIVIGHMPDCFTKSVHRVTKIETSSIPGKQDVWKPEICMTSLFKILQRIRSKLEYDDEAILIQITREGIFFEPEPSYKCTFIQKPSFLRHFE